VPPTATRRPVLPTQLSCPAALSRLQIGVPATVEHGGMETAEQKRAVQYVAETTSVCHLVNTYFFFVR
jgi:hypothetical protein